MSAPKQGIICPECGHIRIACRCDDNDGWCPGCVWCEPEGWAHKKPKTEDECKEVLEVEEVSP